MRVDWNAANPNGDPISTYQLSVNGGGWENVGAGTATNRCGLANSTTYSFQVRAVNSVGPGAGSNVVQARTPGEPGQVGGLNVSGGDRGGSARRGRHRTTTASRSSTTTP